MDRPVMAAVRAASRSRRTRADPTTTPTASAARRTVARLRVWWGVDVVASVRSEVVAAAAVVAEVVAAAAVEVGRAAAVMEATRALLGCKTGSKSAGPGNRAGPSRKPTSARLSQSPVA